MPQSKSTLDAVITETAVVLEPLRRIDSAAGALGLIRDLGWELPTVTAFQNGFSSVASGLQGLVTKIGKLANAAGSDDYAELISDAADSITSVISVVNGVDGLRKEVKEGLQTFPVFVTDSGIATEELPKRLLDYLIITYLQKRSPGLFAILSLCGITEIENVTVTRSWEPTVRGATYPLRRIYWERIPKLFTDPLDIADDVYQWNAAKEFNANLFLQRLDLLLSGFLLPGGLYKQDAAVRTALGRSETDDQELRIPLLQRGDWPDSFLEVGLNIVPLAKATTPAALPKGLAILPYLIGVAEIKSDLSDQWEIAIRGSLDLSSGLGLRLRPPHDLDLDTGLLRSPASGVNGRIEAALRPRKTSEQLRVIFGSEKASLLGFRGAGVGFLAARSNGDQEVAAELNIQGLTVRIDTSGGDGFLQKLLAGIKVDSVIDLTIGWSSKDGLYFRGSGVLEIAIAIHRQLGPILFEAVYLALSVNGGIELVFTASLGAAIGPIAASVQRIGFRVPVSFPADGHGNVGPVNLEAPQFQPPTGAGLVVDAGGLTGGGFLDFNKDEGRYSGILQLNYGEVALVAIGLITTKMPDGSKGFSMLLVIAVEFSPPIQLSFGFTLSGVGGLIGIHRTMVVAVLRDGLKQGTLDSILFPKDPILHANKIISDLRSVFPPEEGRFVVGPMIKIGWGNNVITADLAVLIELPEPIRIVILGKLLAVLPEEKDAIVVLRVDVLGVIEFAKKSLSIDATLYKSHILKYDLTGDAALRLTWGDNPRFAMSLGGFHPRFSPPPAFPSLRRLTLSLSSGSSLELSCKMYQALTPNTLQFGARLDVYAEAGGATLDGGLSFDTLIYFSPFSFTADISGHVAVRYKGHKLAGVRLHLTLSGPTPWRAKGKAGFEILCWDVTARFDKQWGRDDPAVLDAVDPWDQLKQAFAGPDTWGAALPPGRRMVERLKAIDTATGAVVVHPIGRLEVRQKLLPLDLKLAKFGNAPVTGHDTFRITAFEAGPPGALIALERKPLKEFFARAQFEELSANDKLSLPSFEQLVAGAQAGASDMSLGGDAQWRPLAYESIVIDGDLIARPPAKGRTPWTVAQRHLKHAAARRALDRRDPLSRFKMPRTSTKVRVGEDGYTVVQGTDMTPVATSAIPRNDGSLTRIEADQAMAKYVAAHPDQKGSLLVVPAVEVGV